MIPAVLVAAVPSLIKLAEGLFSKRDDGVSRGPEKKSFVLRILEIVWDELHARGMLPDRVRDHKEIVLVLASQIIDEIVAALKKDGSLGSK